MSKPLRYEGAVIWLMAKICFEIQYTTLIEYKMFTKNEISIPNYFLWVKLLVTNILTFAMHEFNIVSSIFQCIHSYRIEIWLIFSGQY